MALTEQLRFILSANGDSAVSAFQKVGRTADSELGKAESRMQKLSGNMTKLGAGSVAFAGIAGAALFKAAGAFQDLAISSSKFSDTTGVAVEDASRWIEVAGDMGVEAGSVEGALNRLNRAIAASPEKLTEYGVAIARANDGTVDVNGTFLNLIDRLNSIPNSSKRAQVATELLGRGWTSMSELIAAGSNELRASLAGVSDAKVITTEEAEKAKQYRAAIDSFKDSIDDLVISLGQGAAPMLGQLATLTGDLIGWFSKLDAVTGGTAGTLATTGVAALGLAGAISFTAGKTVDLVGHFKRLGPAGQTAGVVAGLGLFAMSMRAKQAADRTREIGEAIRDVSRVADSEVLETFLRGLSKSLLSNGGPKKFLDDLAESNIEGARRVREHMAATGDFANFLPILDAAIATAVAEKKQDAETTKEFGDATDDAVAPVENLTDAIAEQKKALDDQADALRDTIDALEEQQSAFQAAADSQYAVSQTGAEYGQFIKELPAKLREAGKNEAERNEILRDGTMKAAEHARAQQKLAEDVAASNGETLTATQKLDIFNQAMLNAAGASKDLAGEIVNYITTARDIPAEVKTQILAAIKAGDIAKAKQLLDETSAEREVALRVEATQSSLREADQAIDAVAEQERVAKIKAVISGGYGGSYGIYGSNLDGSPDNDGDPTNRRYSGGPIPGSEHEAVPIIAHGGEYVLPADVVKAIKRGAPSRGLGQNVGRGNYTVQQVARGSGADPARAADDAVDAMDKVMAAKLELGDITRDEYEIYIEGRLQQEQADDRYSESALALHRLLKHIREEEADEARVAMDAEIKATEAATDALIDKAKAASDLQKATQAVADATADVADADRKAAAAHAARDAGKADDEDVYSADEAARQARRRLAEEAFQGAGARAVAYGQTVGSKGYYDTVRAEVLAYAAANPDLAGLLNDLLIGVPHLATGGPIPGRRGQAVPVVAHGGEYVLTADEYDAIKRHGSGPRSVTYITQHMPGAMSPAAVARQARRYARTNGQGRGRRLVA